MTNQEAIERLKQHRKSACSGCVHPQQMGWCEEHCKLPQALDVAIEALEKQIPKVAHGRYTDYKCPVCGRRIRSGKGSSSYGRRDNFCQRCGQAIDWSDEND